MLSVLFAESGDNMRHLVQFYAPEARAVLDVTFGGGTLSKRLPLRVVGVDLDPESKAHVLARADALPFSDAAFDVGLCDPPYLYGSHALHMGPIGKRTWQKQRSTWKTPSDLRAFACGAARELRRVITGVVLFKIMDSRFKGRLILNHALVTEAFEGHGWRLHDQIVYVRTVTGSFVNRHSAQSTHGYFLVFKRETGQRMALEATVLEEGAHP